MPSTPSKTKTLLVVEDEEATRKLDPVKRFVLDQKSGDDVYTSRLTENTRTQKAKKIYSLSPANDRFPANAQLVAEDIPIGTLREQEWSSMLTPASKADLINRADWQGP